MQTRHTLCPVTSSSPPQGKPSLPVSRSQNKAPFHVHSLLKGLDCKVIRKQGLVLRAPDRWPDLCPGSLVWPGPDAAPPPLFSHLQNNPGLPKPARSVAASKTQPLPPPAAACLRERESITAGEGVEEAHGRE